MSAGKWYGFGQNPTYDEGLKLFGAGSYADAAAAFEQVIAARVPDLHRQAHFYAGESYRLLGEQLLRTGKPEAAIEHLTTALKFHPHFPDIHLQRARALKAAGQPGALEGLADALEINSRYARALFLRGLWRYEGGESDLALLDIAQAGKIQPIYAGEKVRTGEQAHRAGDRNASIRIWTEVGAMEQDDAASFIEAGDQYSRDGDAEAALVEYKMALGLAPKYADVRFKAALVLLDLSRVHEALEQLEIAVKINPDFADAHAYLGIAHRRLGDRTAAREEFRKAVTIVPGHIIASRELDRA